MADRRSGERVIVLHGLWMRGLAMSALAHRLRQAGFHVEIFDFMTVQAPMEQAAQRLRQRLAGQDSPVHLVGHSLGGELALQATAGQDGLAPGRIVCLGSPLAGSAAARQVDAWGLGRLIGSSLDLLKAGIDAWPGPREAGVVAGTLHLGLGGLLGLAPGDSDGTVGVAETRIAGLADHCCVPASHTGLLFSTQAAAQTVHFLRQGSFVHGHGS